MASRPITTRAAGRAPLGAEGSVGRATSGAIWITDSAPYGQSCARGVYRRQASQRAAKNSVPVGCWCPSARFQ